MFKEFSQGKKMMGKKIIIKRNNNSINIKIFKINTITLITIV